MMAVMRAEEAIQGKIQVVEAMRRAMPVEFLEGVKRFENEIATVIV